MDDLSVGFPGVDEVDDALQRRHRLPRDPTTGLDPLATPLGVRPVSHGCVRMADADAEWIFHNVPNGTPVNVIPK